MAVEWFRSPSWTLEDRDEFERRLLRARRSNRPQYLRIKALALAEAGNDAIAQQLIDRIVVEYGEPAFEVGFAHEKRGDFYRARGHLNEAEAEYRLALTVSPTLSATTGEVHLSLAEVLLERDGSAAGAQVESLLADAKSHLTFNSTVFRWQVLSVRLATTRGDRDAQRSAAQAALALVGTPPQFSRHPDVGLARPEPELIDGLRQLASA